MGTNFYWHDSPCAGCGRYDEVHVGKRSMGWSFGFRGYRAAEDSVLARPVQARADWRQVFVERRGVLLDEYGAEYPEPLVWLGEIEAPSAEQVRKEGGWLSEQTPSWYRRPEHDWRDAEGFRFCDMEFS